MYKKLYLLVLGIFTLLLLSLSTIPKPNSIQENKCSDNTLNMKCSLKKPFYCVNKELVMDCNTCGCPENMVCQNNICTTVIKKAETLNLEYESPPNHSLNLEYFEVRYEDNSYTTPNTNHYNDDEIIPDNSNTLTKITTPINIPVLMLSYLPEDKNNPDNIDLNIIGSYFQEGTTIDSVRKKINTLSYEIVTSLENGSAYHKYKNPASKPVLYYSIIDSKEFLRPILRTTNTDFLFLNNGDWGVTADHYNELQNINICDYVENKGVKEVWIWMYHNVPLDSNGSPILDIDRYHVSPTESNMAGPFGDISNSYRINDLPLCKKTYTVYEYNYTCGLGEALENHTHQIEAVLGNADYDTFWNKFVGGKDLPTACGWSHCPPNVMPICETHNYDWFNKTQVYSDCQNWNAERTGEPELLDCHTWSGEICKYDSGTAFKIWWMQNIPNEWWIYIGDFDKAMSEKKGLLY
ncbi:MAG: hypothetical protein PHH15_01765 [Candidatus Pacebacteria bacterium]|nr:hypothetical protein [Candidatus Paceibacterota bacterium]